MCRISIIVACSRNRVIGRNGRLPWDIPEDWNYFLNQTCKGTLVYGHNCYREMLNRSNKASESIVLSRDPKFQPQFGHRAGSLPEALDIARIFNKEIWICGGENVYKESMGIADRLLLTLVDAEIEGDTKFPPWEQDFSHEVFRRESFDTNFKYTFYTYHRDGGILA
ncbi:MAG: dihydrofolate reductase [Opitutae bacterium]|nr:dihydrofolate reductase [Opitutae bacterium]MBT5378669.1 dihydrofolate reductase [Opitutae bacterium]MBT7854095.1 dihydrofolate reductase [Opitutae bacterium]